MSGTNTRPSNSRPRSRAPRDNQVTSLLRVVGNSSSRPRERRQAREELVELHIQLVRHIAHRLARRPDEVEDLTQAGMIGLLRAIDGFDLSRGYAFSTFAVPSIQGEIRRYVRDTGWLLHVPRRAKELQRAVRVARDTLAQSLCREPTCAEIANLIEVPESHVREALDVAASQSSVSVETSDDDDSPAAMATRHLAVNELGFDRAELRVELAPALASLSVRERQVIVLRFMGDQTQSQIAKAIGVSQMQVSRLMNRALGKLREELATAA
jgi:RNA polymerase sigma-B factor